MNESGSRRTRGHGEHRGQSKGEQPPRRDRENQCSFEVPPSAHDRYGSDPRISMQVGGNHQRAASNWPDTRKRLTRCPELDKENPVSLGRPHTNCWKQGCLHTGRCSIHRQLSIRTVAHAPDSSIYTTSISNPAWPARGAVISQPVYRNTSAVLSSISKVAYCPF